MPTSRTFVIVGASLAGASAARELRKHGYDGRIILLGSETHPPYARPPLSKGLLTGKAALESIWVRPDEWYSAEKVELRLGATVASIFPEVHSVVLEDGEWIRYDKLLLATGSRPRKLDIPGSHHAEVRYLRTLDDSLGLRNRLSSGDLRVVVIGSGWIGMEAAAAARELGNNVTILDRNPIALAPVLGNEIGERFSEVHRTHGVEIVNSVVVDEVMIGEGRVTGVRFDGDQLVPADLVLVGVGAIPNTELASGAGLHVDNGVLADEYLRTSNPDVFTAGDIAHAWHPQIGDRIRSEHWMNAMHSGRAAARSMLDIWVAYDEVPYFYTDQFELSMEYSGYGSLAAGAQLVIRGELQKLEFLAFWVREGRLVAGMNVNIWDVNKHVQELIRRETRVEIDDLKNTAIPLTDFYGGDRG